MLINIFKTFRKLGQEAKGTDFTTTLIAWSGFNLHPGQVAAALYKTLYDDFPWLVASNKKQSHWTRIEEIHRNIEWLETPKQAGVDSSKCKVAHLLQWSVHIVQ